MSRRGPRSDKLNYQGEDYFISYGKPLNSYFNLTGINPQFTNWPINRSSVYSGTWEVIDDRLYLIHLSGRVIKETHASQKVFLTDKEKFREAFKRSMGKEASLETFFPDFPDRVFAHWYSGTIRFPQGEVIEEKRDSLFIVRIHEREVFLEFRRGVVVSTRVQLNGTTPTGSDDEGNV